MKSAHLPKWRSTNMASSPDKEHDFFEILAGHGKGQHTAEAMREALQDEANTIQEAETAKLEKLPDYEIARLDAVKKQLIDAGVFAQQSGGKTSRLSCFFDQFKSNFVSQHWSTGLAITASVLIVSTILLQQPNPINDVGLDTMRGNGDLIILSSQPAKTVEELKSKLINAGAEVVAAQINDNEWTLEIDVADKSKVETVKQLLATTGVKVTGKPPYQVIVKK